MTAGTYDLFWLDTIDGRCITQRGVAVGRGDAPVPVSGPGRRDSMANPPIPMTTAKAAAPSRAKRLMVGNLHGTRQARRCWVRSMVRWAAKRIESGELTGASSANQVAIRRSTSRPAFMR